MLVCRIGVSLFNKQISPEPVAKDLGVQLNANLSYNEDITESVSNYLFKLKQINRIKHLLDRKRRCYLWMPSFLANYYIVQASRVIPAIATLTNYKNCKTLQDELFWDLENMTIFPKDQDHWIGSYWMMKLNDATMVFKCISNLAPDYLANNLRLRSRVHDKQTRSASTLNIPFYRLSIG